MPRFFTFANELRRDAWSWLVAFRMAAAVWVTLALVVDTYKGPAWFLQMFLLCWLVNAAVMHRNGEMPQPGEWREVARHAARRFNDVAKHLLRMGVTVIGILGLLIVTSALFDWEAVHGYLAGASQDRFVRLTQNLALYALVLSYLGPRVKWLLGSRPAAPSAPSAS